jgi:hypothetical protein
VVNAKQCRRAAGQDEVRRLTRRWLSMPLTSRLASRSIPTSTARSVRSSSQSIRSSAKVRVLGLPQYEPIASARSKSCPVADVQPKGVRLIRTWSWCSQVRLTTTRL